MRYYNIPLADDIAASCKPLWNPIKVLNILNPDKECKMTCIGNAVSTKQRCRITLGKPKREFIQRVLDEIAHISPDSCEIMLKLETIVSKMLCRHHGQQSKTVKVRWRRDLQIVTSQWNNSENKASAQIYSKLQRQESWRGYGFKNSQESYAGQYYKEKAKEPKQEEKQDDGKQQQQGQETERERKAREQAESYERIRQKAKKAQEDKARKEQEEKEREREEWNKIWERYQFRWDSFGKLDKSDPL